MALQMAGGCWQIAKGGYIFGGSVMWFVFVIVWKILLGSKAYGFAVKTMMWKLQNVSKCSIVHDLYICWPTIVWQAGDVSSATCGRVVHPLYAVWFQECLAYSRWGTGSLFTCLAMYNGLFLERHNHGTCLKNETKRDETWLTDSC